MPIRLDPLPGEALDSWLEALAVRLHLPMGHLVQGLGLLDVATADINAFPHNGSAALPDWTVRLSSAEAAHLSAVSGLTTRRLQAMTMETFDGEALALVPGRRSVDRTKLWSRAGSRFCPHCLRAESRWQLTWRLGWTFACPLHHVLLADRCPSCGQIPRARTHSPLFEPEPGRCPLNHPGIQGWEATGRRCRFYLPDTTVEQLPADSPLLSTQMLIDDWIHGADSGTRPVGCYGPQPPSSSQFLSDLRAIAIRVLSVATDEDLAGFGPADVLARARAFTARPTPNGHRSRPGVKTPLDAGAAGLALSAAAHVMTAPDFATATERIRRLVGPTQQTEAGRIRPLRVEAWGEHITPTLQRIVRDATDERSVPVRWLRRQAPAGPARPPQADTAGQATWIPTLLWSTLSLHLLTRTTAVRDRQYQQHRQALSIALFMACTGTDRAAAIRDFGTTNIAPAGVSVILRALARDDGPGSGLRVLTRLAAQLHSDGTPIDYARRRSVFAARNSLIDPHRWRQAQQLIRNGSLPGVEQADRWLFQELTGSPVSAAHPALAPSTPHSGAGYRRFRIHILPAERQLLHAVAAELLAAAGIDEPVSWEPRLQALIDRADQAEALRMPEVNASTVLDLYWRQQQTPIAIAHASGTSVEHVRQLLEDNDFDWNPRRVRRPAATKPRPVVKTPKPDTTRRDEQWHTRYVSDQRTTVKAIADAAGVTARTVSNALRRKGVEIRPVKPPVTNGQQPSKHDAQVPEIILRYRAGQSTRTISLATGVPFTSVHRLLRRAEEPTRTRSILTHATPEQRAALDESWRRQYLDENRSLASIAAASAVHAETVTRRLRALGVSIRTPVEAAAGRPNQRSTAR